MRRIRRNADPRIRDLQRSVEQGDVQALVPLVQLARRAQDPNVVAQPLIDMGWERAVDLIAPMDLGTPRDEIVLELGRELVRRGWAPNVPLGYQHDHDRPGLEAVWRHGIRELVRRGPTVRLRGEFTKRARTWRFQATYGFQSMYPIPATSRVNQGPKFFFVVEPIGKNYRATELAGGITKSSRYGSPGPLPGVVRKRLAPKAWFLARWNDSQATTMPQGKGGQHGGLHAGTEFHYPENPLSFSTPAEETRLGRRVFLRSARAGYLPGDVPPPPGTPQPEVMAWLMNPQRLKDLRALFYGDLYLGGFMLPPEELVYDPATLMARGAVQENPAQDDGRYVFVHACPGSTYQDMHALYETARPITRQTFARKIGREAWAELRARLGYDRHVPISRDPRVTYYKGVYRGVPAVWLTYSRTEYIYTLDGQLGPSLAHNPPRIRPCGSRPRQIEAHVVERDGARALFLLDADNLRAYTTADWRESRCPLLAGFRYETASGVKEIAREGVEIPEVNWARSRDLMDLAERVRLPLVVVEDVLIREGFAWHRARGAPPERANPSRDERIRALRRRAETGDPEAQARLAKEEARVGDPFLVQLAQAKEEIAYAIENGQQPVLLPEVTRWSELFSNTLPTAYEFEIELPPHLHGTSYQDVKRWIGERHEQLGAPWPPALDKISLGVDPDQTEAAVRARTPTPAWGAPWTFHDALEDRVCTVLIGPDCSVRGPGASGAAPGYSSLWVRPTERVTQAVQAHMLPRCYDQITFEVVIRASKGKPATALVIAQWNQILATRWLAIIPAVEVPTFPPKRPLARNPRPRVEDVRQRLFGPGGPQRTPCLPYMIRWLSHVFRGREGSWVRVWRSRHTTDHLVELGLIERRLEPGGYERIALTDAGLRRLEISQEG